MSFQELGDRGSSQVFLFTICELVRFIGNINRAVSQCFLSFMCLDRWMQETRLISQFLQHPGFQTSSAPSCRIPRSVDRCLQLNLSLSLLGSLRKELTPSAVHTNWPLRLSPSIFFVKSNGLKMKAARFLVLSLIILLRHPALCCTSKHLGVAV